MQLFQTTYKYIYIKKYLLLHYVLPLHDWTLRFNNCSYFGRRHPHSQPCTGGHFSELGCLTATRPCLQSWFALSRFQTHGDQNAFTAQIRNLPEHLPFQKVSRATWVLRHMRCTHMLQTKCKRMMRVNGEGNCCSQFIAFRFNLYLRTFRLYTSAW